MHRWPVKSPHKWLVTRKMFPFDDVTLSASFASLRNMKIKSSESTKNCWYNYYESAQQNPVRLPRFPHDDVIKWKQFPRHWPFVRGTHLLPLKMLKGQWRGASMFSLNRTSINGWVNNRKDSDMRWDAIALIMTSLLCVNLASLEFQAI